jgi:hypothetical protein
VGSLIAPRLVLVFGKWTVLKVKNKLVSIWIERGAKSLKEMLFGFALGFLLETVITTPDVAVLGVIQGSYAGSVQFCPLADVTGVVGQGSPTVLVYVRTFHPVHDEVLP